MALHPIARTRQVGISARTLIRALVCASLLASSGCRFAGAATYNLDELLDSDNSFRYLAHQQTGTQWLLGGLVHSNWLSDDSLLNPDKKAKPIPNPSKLALRHLLTLRDGALSPDDHWLHAEQVRQFTRYAAFCPSRLARERCYLELGVHALRLQLGAPIPEPERAANAPELEEAIADLARALNSMVSGGRRVDATTRRDFEAACELNGRLELDIEGGWRLLKVIASFGQVSRVPESELAPLFELGETVQRHLVALALSHGCSDADLLVRAAAWRANHAAFGAAFLHEAFAALVMNRPTPGRRPLVTPTFRLSGDWQGDDPVFLAVMDLVRREGLPLVPGLSPGQRADLRFRQLYGLLQITYLTEAYGERSRSAAMLTLAKVSGSDLTSLRKEDWDAWWNDFRPPEVERINALLRSESQGGARP